VLTLITLGLFLALACGLFVMLTLFEQRNGRARLLRDRLTVVDSAAERRPSAELELLRDELLSEIPALNRMLAGSNRIGHLQKKLNQAQMQTRAGKFLLVSASIGVVAMLITQMVMHSSLLGLLAAALGAAMPYGYVHWRISRRFRKFEAQFPEAIDLLARAIRAGHAFSTALEMIGNELAEPVSGEFRALFEEQKFGLPLRDALLNLADRVPLVDVKFFVTAVTLQRETGGNLAEILDKLSHIVRERFKILRQVSVYTAQGRLTMMILMALPPGLVVLLIFVNPEFIEPLFKDPIGHLMVGFGLVMQTIGFFMIRKIIHIRV
jgi:tight adherence protein B